MTYVAFQITEKNVGTINHLSRKTEGTNISFTKSNSKQFQE